MIREVTAHDQIPSKEGDARHRRACRRRRAAPGGRGGDAFRRTWREWATAGAARRHHEVAASPARRASAPRRLSPRRRALRSGRRVMPRRSPTWAGAATACRCTERRRQLDHGGPDHRPVGRDAQEAPAVRLQVHQHRRRLERRHRRVRPARAEQDAVPERSAGRHRPHPRERPEGRALQHPGHLARRCWTPTYPIYGHPGCTTGDLAEQPLQQGDYWGFGYRMDMAKPCAQAYIDSIADSSPSWGVDFLKFDSVTPGSGHNDLSMRRARRGQGLVAGARPAQDLARALLGARHQLRGLLEVGRERLAGRLGRRVLLPG